MATAGFRNELDVTCAIDPRGFCSRARRVRRTRKKDDTAFFAWAIRAAIATAAVAGARPRKIAATLGVRGFLSRPGNYATRMPTAVGVFLWRNLREIRAVYDRHMPVLMCTHAD